MAGLKSNNWTNYPKKRCTNEKCKQRIRSFPELKICNKCVNKINIEIDAEMRKKRKLFKGK